MENANSKDQSFRASKEDVKSDESTKSQSKKSDIAKDKLAGLHFLKQSFRTLSVPKKSTSKPVMEKHKNEPTRFLGEGVTFKAKLIGILEVEEARGDRMCQEALYELKMAVRAAGEHKQRINIVIAVDGIRLRDEKTGDCLHHHPVHKISFIAQDVADSRAFGYIFGSPDTTHRFFGIKTDKAASQVVMAMRDLFQAVFELKKREVEVARQNIEQHHAKYGSSMFLDSVPAASKGISDSRESIVKAKPVAREDAAKSVKNKTQTATVIADLMDLELELNSLQQGLSQMERLTPSDPFGPSPSVAKEDPFGDSFTPPPCITTPPPTKLPPPPASGDRRKVGSTSSAASQPELHWFDKETHDLFASDKNVSAPESATDKEKKDESKSAESTARDLYDIFTELDPLGTGRSKPYMDKKDFFQELKNPPKKQLKDLKSSDNFANDSKGLFSEDTEKLYDEHFRKYNSVDSDRRITLAEELSKAADAYFESASDPFETSFANFASFENADERRRSPHIYRRSPASLQEPTTTSSTGDSLHSSVFKPSARGAYKSSESGFPPPITSQSAESFAQHRTKSRWVHPNEDLSKQKIVINLRKVLSSADDTDKENDSPVMEEATVLKNLDATSPCQGEVSSDSFESIPEPPPRPTASPMAAQPPPLPPKKLLLPVTMKPPPRPTSDSNSHYDYIENYESFGSRQKLNGDVQIPPLPAPARKPKFGHDDTISRHRPHHKQQLQSATSSECEYYLTPISKSHPDHRREERQQQRRVKPSLDITLSQLSSTNFEDLATMLRIPASALSKMTLKELTECLSRLSVAECQKLESNMSNRVQRNDETTAPPRYRSLRESFDDPASTPSSTTDFKVNFEEKFPTKSAQPQQVDRYAVFRELIEQEEQNQRLEASTQSQENGEVETVLSEDTDQNVVEEPEKPADAEAVAPSDDDKYAALRTIPPSAASESKSGDENAKELSEKEDSAAEVMLPADDSEAGATVDLPKEKDPLDALAESVGKMELQVAAVAATAPPATPTKPKDENDGRQMNELGKNWAKFDMEPDAKEELQRSKTPSWPEESQSKFAPAPASKAEEDEAILKPFRYRKHRRHRRWNDDDVEEDEDDDYGDDSEENWESSKKSLGSSWEESSWRENGWSDRDSLYDDAEASPPPPPAMAGPGSYRDQKMQLRKKGYHRKFSSSPHKKPADYHHPRRLDQQHSPWDDEEPPDWQKRKYKEEERKMRTPPWTGGGERSKRWDDEKDADELMLLKMMLGKKRLKVLEEQLFRHYHEQLSSDSSKKSSSYYHYPKDSDGEASSGGNKLRYSRAKYYTQRPKSADKARKIGAGGLQLRPEDTEEFYAKKYRRRPYSHDELSVSEEERWTERHSPLLRKPPPSTGGAVRSRHQSQTSPFEDNFTTATAPPYETDSPADSHHHAANKSKTLRYPSGAVAKKAEKRSPHDLHPYSSYDKAPTGGRSSRESSQRQSPFEDDFAPPEVAQKGGDAKEPTDDDVFFSSSGTGESGRRGGSRTMGRSHGKRVDKMASASKYYENVELRKKTAPDSFYEKVAKEKYKYAAKEGNGEVAELKSPKKGKGRHDPFNDNVPQGYESKTVPRLQKTKSKSKVQQYDSESDSAEPAKWKDEFGGFAEPHGRGK